jgi:acetylornithine/succinyldiaminopimelate/putrescine aminotransferase
MAIAALEQIVEWDVARVAATLARLTAEIARRATVLGLEPVPEQQRGPHMLGVRLPEAARARLLSALTDVNCFAAIRGDALRIAPHLHVSDQDLDRLLDGLATAVAR